MASRDPLRRILIRLPNWLGDALLARPLLHALRRSLPDASIVAVGPEPVLGLLSGEATFDRGEAWPRSRGPLAALIRRVRAERPDAALVLPPSFSSAWFAWRTGARMRAGYAHELRAPLLSRALRRPARGDRHLSDEYLELGRVLGAEAATLPVLRPPEAGERGADELLRRLGLEGRRVAILGPGALYGPAKRWAADRFAALGRRLAENGHRVLVCGVAAERDACESVAAGIGPAARSLAGATDLAVQAALCARAAAVACNDSGLAHLAAAVGAPTVVVFGSTSSAWTAPLGRRVRVVQHAPVCSPCFQRRCRIGYVCLAAVTVAEVQRALAELAA